PTRGNSGPGASPISTLRDVGSRALFVIDRHTGKLVWWVRATGEFRHNAVCVGGGRLYAIDRANAVRVFDLRTGKPVWNAKRAIFGTWLSYSKEYEVLMEAGRMARDTLGDEPR